MSSSLRVDDLGKFHRLPCTERRKLASDLLASFSGMHKALERDRHDYTDLNGLVAYVGVKQELEQAVAFWRREMQRAAWDSKNKKHTSGAGRSPAGMAHGCAALASLAGSFIEAINRSGNAGKVTA